MSSKGDVRFPHGIEPLADAGFAVPVHDHRGFDAYERALVIADPLVVT